MAWYNIPNVESCCFCVPDLKTAVTIIAVLGIVTSPAVSWAVLRHSYVIRVSCVITTQSQRPDVFDVNLNNVLSFGFAANAGLGPSCLSPEGSNSKKSLVMTVKYLGWVVLVLDIFFLIASIYLLVNMYRGTDKRPAKYFMIAVAISILMSFIYALLYVSACVTIGGSFPVFELIFAFVDVGIYAMWIYFAVVLRSYVESQRERHVETSRYSKYLFGFSATIGTMFQYFSNQLNRLYSYFIGYISIILIHNFLLFSLGLLFNSSSFLQKESLTVEYGKRMVEKFKRTLKWKI